ncbi:MAG: hypothetical protein U0359_09235 [Byssovorax sp.]
MRRSMRGWVWTCGVIGALVAAGCGGGVSSTTSTSTTGSTTGAGGSSTTSTSTTGSTTGAGGAGGSMLGPFTSHGAASYEAQTALAADGKGSAVVAWIGFFADGSSSIGYAVSRDAGASWTKPAYVPSPGGRFASSPALAVDGQGRFSLAWLGFRIDPQKPDEHVYLARLDAATESFGEPVIASDDGSADTRDFDKPSLAVDANDNLLVTWADFTGFNTGTPPALTFARSVDGTTFNRTTVTADMSFGNLASLCVDASAGPAAPVFLVHLVQGATLLLHRSVDQGKTWQPMAVPVSDVVFQDPTCVAHGSNLWIAYAEGMAAFSPSMDSPADLVRVVHSGNAGVNFDAPALVSIGPAGPARLFPRISRSPSGELQIAYYEGTPNNPANLMLATSSDGNSWTTNGLAMAGTFTLDRTLASWLGDVLGIAATASGTLMSYTDNSEGKSHIALAVPAPK